MRALSWSFTCSSSPLRLAARAAWLGLAATGCTLITDVDRERIPDPPLPPFAEVDAGPQPGLDASVPHELDASAPPPPAGAGDGGALDAGALDGGLDASAG